MKSVIMDHILKNSVTAEYSRFNPQKSFFLNEWKKVRYMWKQDFKYYTPIEKLFIVVCFGQVLKGIGNLLDIEYPSLASLVPKVLSKSNVNSKFERALFFDIDESRKNIIPCSKALALLK
jgi:hypothetical protein